MRILGIETSFDETGVAVVENGTKVVAEALATSQQIHIESGGVIPEKAAREQVKLIIPALQEALSGMAMDEIDAIAVTYGPGLIGSLLVGVETAKTLSYVWNKPIIPVNHLVAHSYACWLGKSLQTRDRRLPRFPVVALVVSGAHTDLVHMKDHGLIKRIGSTRDDAAGEAFDKCARLLGFPYPGGPALANAATSFLEKQGSVSLDMIPGSEITKLDLFPRPMINTDDYDFSFSGLKTAVLNYVKEKGVSASTIKKADSMDPGSGYGMTNDIPIDWLAANVQEAIVDVLIEKSIKVIGEYSPLSFLLSGGVAANKRLREKFTERFNIENLKVKLFMSPPKYATDNAAVIASAAYFNYKPADWRRVVVDPELRIDTPTL